MANDRLRPGQIQPYAKPVSSFIRTQAVNPSAPGRPEMLPSASGVNIIQRGNVANVKGSNSLRELSEAVKKLVPLADAGFEIYASKTYQDGQQQLLKAARNNNNAMLKSEKNYAAENRLVHRNDTAAGILMDELNPYRKGGMINMASKITATLVPQAFSKAWLENGVELAKLDPGDPAINKLKAIVINDLANAYGLDEFSPGFMDEVIPAINKEWEEFQTKHYSANVKHKKHVKEIQLADGLETIMESDLKYKEKYSKIAEYIAEASSTSGLNGEASKMIENAIIRLGKKLKWEAVANKDSKARALLRELEKMPSGIVGDDGKVLSIGDVYGPRLYVDTDVIDTVAYKEYNKDQKNLGASFEETYASKFNDVRDNPEALRELKKQALDDEKFKDLVFTEKLKQINIWTEAINEDIENSVEITDWNKYFEGLERKIGNEFNVGDEDKIFWERMNGISLRATEKRVEFLNRYKKIKKEKIAVVQQSIDVPNLKSVLKDRLAAILEDKFPDMETGIFRDDNFDIMEYLATGELDKTTAEAKIAQALYEKALIGIQQKAISLKRDELTIVEQNQAMNDAIEKYLASPLFKTHLGQTDTTTETNKGNEEGDGIKIDKSNEVQTSNDRIYFKSSMRIPKDRLETWETIPIYSQDQTRRLWEMAKEGKELPLNLLRGANQNNINAAQLVLQQIDLWEKLNGKEFEWSPSSEERLLFLKKGNLSKGFTDGALTAAPLFGTLASNSNVLNNILTGNSISKATLFSIPFEV
tara:strand:- start:7563 stop:9845 length:2283 start_codon:yes stop_codon:yes gene_type:complete